MDNSQTHYHPGGTGCAASTTCLHLGRSCAAVSAWPGIHRAVVECARGQRLQKPADAAQWIRTVHCGLLALCAALPDGRRQIICLAGPGEALCSCSAPDLECWVEALAPSTVCEVLLPVSTGEFVGNEHAQALMSLLELSRERLERTLAHVVTLGRLDGRERLASFLVDMARRVGHRDEDHWLVNIPMTREDMADYLGLNADTITRILGKLKREGVLIARSAHDFMIPNLAAMDSRGSLTYRGTGLAVGAESNAGR